MVTRLKWIGFSRLLSAPTLNASFPLYAGGAFLGLSTRELFDLTCPRASLHVLALLGAYFLSRMLTVEALSLLVSGVIFAGVVVLGGGRNGRFRPVRRLRSWLMDRHALSDVRYRHLLAVARVFAADWRGWPRERSCAVLARCSDNSD